MIPASKLAEWRAAAEKATPGPWEQTAEVSEEVDHWVDSADSLICDTGESPYEQVAANALFIALSREAVPALLAENEALRALAKRLADAAQHCKHCRDCGDGPCCDLCDVDAACASFDGVSP